MQCVRLILSVAPARAQCVLPWQTVSGECVRGIVESGDEMSMTDFAIELSGICKSFGAVAANRDVEMNVAKGSIHGIIGENGAGKSTLMSILYGYYQADAGTIHVNGQETRIRNSQEAIRLGIGMVHQHFMLVDTFTVLENIVLGAEGGLVLKTGWSRRART